MKIGLAFSGGKDSWACLWLCRAELQNITVLWVNTGKNYPEALAIIDKARAICPNFVEIGTDQKSQNDEHGIPADVVPVDWTQFGMDCTEQKPVKIQSYLQCCYKNISEPLRLKAKELGITHLISGQRNEDVHKETSTNGQFVDGLINVRPIETWTKKEVIEFLSKHMELPEHFNLNHSSMDCYDCTAFRRESKDRVKYTQERHPMLYQEYKKRKDALDNAISEALNG